MDRLVVSLRRSLTNKPAIQRRIAQSLGLHRPNDVAVHENTPSCRGAIEKARGSPLFLFRCSFRLRPLPLAFLARTRGRVCIPIASLNLLWPVPFPEPQCLAWRANPKSGGGFSLSLFPPPKIKHLLRVQLSSVYLAANLAEEAFRATRPVVELTHPPPPRILAKPGGPKAGAAASASAPASAPAAADAPAA